MTQQTLSPEERRRRERARDARFVRSLERLVPQSGDGVEQRGDRAALAALRRALGGEPGERVEAYPTIYAALGAEELSPREERPYFIVGPLFAIYPEGGWRGERSSPYEQRNLGASLARLAAASQSGSVELRFQALLDSDPEELPSHLRHAVSLLRAYDVPIAWAQLLDDVRHWDAGDRRVQRIWARTYWSRVARDGGEPGATPSSEDSKDESDEEDD